MRTQPEISVVIPTRGRSEILRDVLESLFQQTYDVSRMEVITVIDGDDPATHALAADLRRRGVRCRLSVLEQPRSGQGPARNLGIRYAAGRIILMLDDDIIAVPRLVEAHARHHAGAGDLVVTGPVPLEPREREPAHHRDLRRWWDGELERKSSSGHRPSFQDFTTGNVSVPRERLLEVGGFDPMFSGYGREDYELGYRLIGAGLRFRHEVQAVGFHRYRKEPLEWLRQWRDMGRADVLFTRKHPDLALEIMGLCLFQPVPWIPTAVGAAERLVLRLNRRGGRVWARAASFAMASYYWAGIRAECGDPSELKQLTQLRKDAGLVAVASRRWKIRQPRVRIQTSEAHG